MAIKDYKNLPKDTALSSRVIENEHALDLRKQEIDELKVRSGKVGIWLGFGHSMKINIAAITIGLVSIIGLTYTLVLLYTDQSKNPLVPPILDFWNILLPIITLALGFIFGKGRSSE